MDSLAGILERDHPMTEFKFLTQSEYDALSETQQEQHMAAVRKQWIIMVKEDNAIRDPRKSDNQWDNDQANREGWGNQTWQEKTS